MSKGFFDNLKRILFPRGLVCISCGAEAVTDEYGFCSSCAAELEPFNSAPPLDSVDGYSASFIYGEASSAAVKRLKYNGARYIARQLAATVRLPEEWDADCVVPVPLHYKRENKRGYNQSALIAKHLCKMTGLEPRFDILVKTKNTEQQARLSEAGRRRNLKNSFSASSEAAGRRILLLDDVRTTGTTLSECANTLKKAGAEKVYAYTICFAKPK
jgi:ComF family protein